LHNQSLTQTLADHRFLVTIILGGDSNEPSKTQIKEKSPANAARISTCDNTYRQVETWVPHPGFATPERQKMKK
jgi:hypothetical protein